jgi:hypothetical protein
VLDALNDVIGGAFFYIVKYVTLGIAYVVKGLGAAWNGIVGAIAWVFDRIDDVLGWFGIDTNLGGALRKLQINMDGLDRAITNLNSMTLKQASASYEAADAAEKTADAMEQLTNVPQGYKIELARYNAAVGDQRGWDPNAPRVGDIIPHGPITPNTTIGSVTIVSDDPEQIWRDLVHVIARDSVVRTGSTVVHGAPYSTEPSGHR